MSQHNKGRTFEGSSVGGGDHGRESSESDKGRSSTARQVKQSAKEAVGKVKEQASSAVGQQQDVAAKGLESVSQAFRQSAEGLNDSSVPAIGKILENAADSIEGLAESIREGDFRGVIDGVEDWARRHPAIFLGGTLVAGLLLARFLKSSRERELDADDRDISMHSESHEFEPGFERARASKRGYGRQSASASSASGMSQYGSGGARPSDVRPGMTVPGTTPIGQGGPVEPSSAWEEP
jgi:hypothetical protein